MRFRKLRIAWSVVCGIACVLLIVPWVRSYWRYDEVRYFSFAEGHLYSIYSDYGVLQLSYGAEARFKLPGRTPLWKVFSQGHDTLDAEEKAMVRKAASKQFRWSNRLPSSFSVKAPYWLITPVIVASGVVPWLRWRFSLRTLLIAITLLAIMLGVIVYVFHQSDTKPAAGPPSPWIF